MTYYSERKKIENGVPAAPVYHTGDRDAMERQFHLNCANILGNERNDLDVCEWGTIEKGWIERKRYTKPVAADPEPEPEEPEENQEPTAGE